MLGWIPGTQRFLFISDRGGEGFHVWMIRVVDGTPEGVPSLVSMKGDVFDWSLSAGPVQTPTGGWAFYYREKSVKTRRSSGYLAQLDPDTGRLLDAPSPVSQPTAGREMTQCPVFSYDGKYLAYYVAPSPKPSPDGPLYGPGNIVIRSLETGQEREVALSPQLSIGQGQPWLNWAPDGRSILIWGCAETGRRGIYQVDIDTGKLDPVALDAAPAIDWQGGQPRNFGETEGDTVGYGEFFPDGKTLFYPRAHRNPNLPVVSRCTEYRILARDLETGQEREIYRNPEGVFSFPTHSVSPDGKHVLIGGGSSLEIVPAAGGEPRELFKFGDGSENSLCQRIAWAPRQPACTVRENHGRKG